MKFPWMVPAALVSALVVTGCDSGEEEGSVFERSTRVDTPNGTLEIHRGTTTTIEECLIFDIGDGGISARAIGSDGAPTDDFNLLLLEGEGGELGTPDGDLACEVNEGDDGNSRLRSADGTVLFTLADNFVLRGDVTLPEHRWARFFTIACKIAFEISGDQVFDRFAPRFREPDADDVLVTATAAIEDASDFRKLTVAALVDGECGSAGYDAYPDPDVDGGGDGDDDDGDGDD